MSRKTLASLDKRIENEKQLAESYGKWIGVLAAKQSAVLTGLLMVLAGITSGWPTIRPELDIDLLRVGASPLRLAGY